MMLEVLCIKNLREYMRNIVCDLYFDGFFNQHILMVSNHMCT